MNKLNVNRTGLVIGLLMGGLHLCWALLVAIGWAKPLMDCIFRLHFMHFTFDITPFDAGTALMLVGVTFVIGYILGAVFSALWNKLQTNA